VYSSLPDILLTEDAQQQVARDCQELVEQELAAKSGLSATALKVAYRAVTTSAPGYYQSTVEKMVPDLLEKLQPFWADFHAEGGGQFGDYLVMRGGEVSEAVLAVTDRMTDGSPQPTIVKAYNAVRGDAGEHIEAALPGVGALVERYAA
jgi:hypothetical protein